MRPASIPHALLVATAIACASLEARAAGPACDAGVCADGDGDGFVACACAPPGVPCDCDDADPSTFPGAPEPCDFEKDRNCNGAAKEACKREDGCLDGVCVQRCIPLDDFGCPPTTGMRRQPDNSCLCAPQDCTVFGCTPGFTCDDDKACVPSCHRGVKCPYGQRCRGFGCVDPCANVVCPAGSACVDGICKPACDCAGASCANGETCDATTGKCVEAACASITCAAGTHCEGGTCIDDCAGVVCPPKRVCRSQGPKTGCVDLCDPSPCPLGYRCDWRTGACAPPDVGDGGLFVPAGPTGDPLDVVGGGLACTTTRGSAMTAMGVLALVPIVVVARRRLGRIRRTR